MKKYAVFSSYDYNRPEPYDILKIYRASENDITMDGTNVCGKLDAMYLECFETLEEAIRRTKYWPTAIKFDSTFNDEEKAIIVKVGNELMKDEKFCLDHKTKPRLEDVPLEGFTFV